MFTKTETRVYEQLVRGLGNQEIAATLSLSIKTVKYHATRIFEKRNVKTRSQLIVKHFSEVIGELKAENKEMLSQTEQQIIETAIAGVKTSIEGAARKLKFRASIFDPQSLPALRRLE